MGVRPGDLALSDDDERVLALAVPLLVQVVRARARAADLQRARVAATSVREEERRRLRRDLHDGLGPRLTGIAFTADAARLASSDETRLPMLDRLRDEAATAIQEIRDLVDGLRPPALDELGLLGALSLRAESFPNVDVVITADALPVLPAAVEVAAYRIVAEALTNVARHSGAGRADVVLGPCDTHLPIEVRDDGRSDAAWVVGVGLSSMRERASELGGTVSVDRSPTGTVVAARLPLGPPARGPAGQSSWRAASS
ncbi:hypothetical protein N798_07625 [Knoellia flava TL1]|uniref:Histidine kinase/HSP90-like ATPase domain-containing protein n=2 Tax=Knoellia flava TaxID=913969 RepID=A0A8H9FW00_9MICO|nr:sensor histidine kinase [Knoellia flava]KGN32234.1 hypothetical protein N798_07625 [Knoellia flava TL1]GGB89619.1 hypothetical protein GCM10011314_31830 [Knoellia flava]